jgi:gliding motility-associated-like protein
MKKIQAVIIVLCCCIPSLWAQRENVWVLGEYGLSFNTPLVNINLINGTVFGESGASVCDANGQLLFYTDGSYVKDRNNNFMPNGQSSLTSVANFATGSTTQGACIVPVPGNAQQYYIFSLTSVEFAANAGKLFYSKVDMALNNGMGDVIVGEKAIPIGNNHSEKLIAIQGSRCNIWVITSSRIAPEFRAYEVTEAGVNTTPVTSPTGSINYNHYTLGTLTASPDNKKILVSGAPLNGGGLEIFQFDQASGMLSNPLLVDSSEPFYAACFSSNQTKIYGINYYHTGNIYQYDLNQPNPLLSKTLIRSGVGFSFDKIKLGFDGKVYVKGKSNTLDVIHQPNVAGLGCDFESDAIIFNSTGNISGALPNSVPLFIKEPDTFSVTHVAGPCWGVNFEITGNADGWNYSSNGINNNHKIFVDTPGTYWLSYYTANCRLHVDTYKVTFPNGVLPHIFKESACRNLSNAKASASTYQGDPVTYYYTWMKGNSNDTLSQSNILDHVPSGFYKVHIATNTGCDTVLTFELTAIDPNFSFTVSDTLVCEGGIVQTMNTSHNHYQNFNWYWGDGNNSIGNAPSYQYLNAGVYALKLVAEGSVCKDSSTIHITVDAPDPDFRLHLDKDQICKGDKVYFNATSDSTLQQLYLNFGDGTYYTHKGVDPFQHAYDTDGLMYITANGQYRACPDIVTVDSIMVYPLPLVDLGTDSFICLGGNPVSLYNTVTPTAMGYKNIWSTGDTTQSIQVFHHGQYHLQVVAEPIGCATTESVIVKKDCYTDVPNAFSPNGDGENDYFFPKQYLSEGVVSFSMVIFNRWGQKIFETQNANGRGWDGSWNNVVQPSGVYVYHISVTYHNGKSEQYTGNITLLK